jgi:hypothetical protein
MDFVLRTVFVTVLLLVSAAMCATVVWASMHVSKARKEEDELQRIVDEAVNEGIQQFEQERRKL